MKAILIPAAGLLCAWLSAMADDGQTNQIQIIDSYNKGSVTHSDDNGLVDDSAVNYVKLRIKNGASDEFDSKTDLLLSNATKTIVDKPLIFRNTDRTIIGFNASVARATYKITVVYISCSGETVINQNFNTKVADILRKNSPNTRFDADGLYLDRIDGSVLGIGFQRDSGKGSFKFRVRLEPDGQLQMIPHSLKFEN